MLDMVTIGAQVSMTPKEVDALCGDGVVRLVTCPNGRVIGGVGPVGLAEHTSATDLLAFVELIKSKREELARLAAAPQPDNPRANLYTFVRIG